jgi:hypothetical protein
MSINGRWEGKLNDVTGVTAVVQAALRESSGKVEGDFDVYLVSQGDASCCQVERQLVHSGPVGGRYDAKKGRVAIDYKLTIGMKPVSIHLDAAVREAAPHAKQSIHGCYRVDSGGSDLTLEGGGIVLWQYR